jgi:C1A family cysteine protease
MWSYNISKFAIAPSIECYETGLKNQALSYWRVPRNLRSLRMCLAEGFPFVFGFSVYESFGSVGATGKAYLPEKGESLEGGHAVAAIGYDDSENRFLVRNSWGSEWGNAGYFTMPYNYLLNTELSDDFWTLRIVE